jgi:hypothetical protein
VVVYLLSQKAKIMKPFKSTKNALIKCMGLFVFAMELAFAINAPAKNNTTISIVIPDFLSNPY